MIFARLRTGRTVARMPDPLRLNGRGAARIRAEQTDSRSAHGAVRSLPDRPRMQTGRNGSGRDAPSTSLLIRLASLGTEFAGIVAVPTLVGYWLDYRFETGPIWVLIGGVLGIVGGLWRMISEGWRLTSGTQRSNNKQESDRDS